MPSFPEHQQVKQLTYGKSGGPIEGSLRFWVVIQKGPLAKSLEAFVAAGQHEKNSADATDVQSSPFPFARRVGYELETLPHQETLEEPSTSDCRCALGLRLDGRSRKIICFGTFYPDVGSIASLQKALLVAACLSDLDLKEPQRWRIHP